MSADTDIPRRSSGHRILLVWIVPLAAVILAFSLTGNDQEHFYARQSAAAASRAVAAARAAGQGPLSPLAAPVTERLIRKLAKSPPDPSRTPAAPSSGSPSEPVNVRVLRVGVGQPIRPGFVGFSLEFNAITGYAGDGSVRNRPLERLIEGVAGGRPLLRIGGNSTDNSWWPVPGVRRPAGITYEIGPGFNRALARIARDTRARLILGVNLKLNRPDWSAYEARKVLSGLNERSVTALEIGNEPSYYGTLSWFKDSAGHQVFARHHQYTYPQWRAEFDAVARRIPGRALVAPSVGGYTWLPETTRSLGRSPRIQYVAEHRYPLTRCASPESVQYASLHKLFSDQAASGFVEQLTPYVRATHRAGRKFVLDEVNSISCGGKHGLSDTFASALWAPGALFAMAAHSVDAVNIHTFPKAIYAPFSFRAVTGGYSAVVNPVYYGLELFHLAAPTGARVQSLRMDGPSGARAMATRLPGGEVRLLLINDSVTQARSYTAASRGAARLGLLLRMSAPAVNSPSGVTIGGVSYGPDGVLQGNPEMAAVRATGGRFKVTVPPAGAALLILPPR